MSLVTLLLQNLPHLPAELQPEAQRFIDQLSECLTNEAQQHLCTNDFAVSVLKACTCSQFIRDSWLRNPQLLEDMVANGALHHPLHRDNYSAILDKLSCESDTELAQQLRLFRRREMVRIAWRDLAGWSDLEETLTDLTLLAEACIQTALDFIHQQACQRWGIPTLTDGTPFNIVVLGMGKLGAWELNYSSDIDLIFAYAEDGTLTEKKEISYSEFFTRICRSLVKMLDEITVDGFVFRTDVRLRPFGDSGPLIMTFDGMENYYQTQAREWERYAMIKARQVAGDEHSGHQLAAMIKPFVYRRYLDYGAFEELRSLKFQITQELRRKDRMENVKLGPGGIREIEFIGQAFQLIRGGQEHALQQREIQVILDTLAELKLMQLEEVAILQFAYRFLRRTENHIQQYQDKQTHDLPTDPLIRLILAYSMDFPDWDSFKTELDGIREQVHGVFEQIFSLSTQDSQQQSAKLIWSGKQDDETLLELLADYGFERPIDISEALANFKASNAIRRMSSKGEAVLARLMPLLIQHISQFDHADVPFKRILQLFEAVAGRNVYFSLLAENPEALDLLIKLAAASPWICEHLASNPILFDELLDARTLFAPLQRQELSHDLARELDKIDIHDGEQLMITLRQFKHLNVLRVAAADIVGAIPVMVVSDYLTWIAEAVLEHVLRCAWLSLGSKHGYPPNMNDQPSGFAIVGFGKLGGIELGYGSDLDLVFIQADCDTNAATTGEKAISVGQFYLRLGQKIRHILDTKLLAGILYEVDLRLRPNGDSGLLVSHIETYREYLLNDAWTWEHQALVRARFITGDPQLQGRYEAIRSEVLRQPREYGKLQNEVREMREKMREHLVSKDPAIFDLKQSHGGIADIEFMVQFAILAHSAQYPDLTTYTDNVRLLEGLTSHHLVTEVQASLLKNAYCGYRDYGHHQILKGLSAITDNQQFAESRTTVQKLWQQLMES